MPIHLTFLFYIVRKVEDRTLGKLQCKILASLHNTKHRERCHKVKSIQAYQRTHGKKRSDRSDYSTVCLVNLGRNKYGEDRKNKFVNGITVKLHGILTNFGHVKCCHSIIVKKMFCATKMLSFNWRNIYQKMPIIMCQ